MKIVDTDKYKSELREIVFYIKQDKVFASLKFVQELKKTINALVDFPYKNRKSLYFQSEDIRDLTFKGYTIIYEVFEEKIEIMTIFNQNKPSPKAQ